MALKTVLEVLERVRAYHREVALLYEQMEATAEKERVQILLDYLISHERHMDENLAAYEKEVGKETLHACFSGTTDTTRLEHTSTVHLDPAATVNDVLAMALRLDNCLVEFFQDMLSRAKNEHCREFLTRMLDHEIKAEMKLARDSVELQDT